LTRIKICGVCRPQDAEAAAEAGASFIGVILAPGRRRTQTPERAAEIYAATPLRRVGVFVDATPAEMARLADQLLLDVVQLHGDESPETMRELAASGPELWKAVHVRGPGDIPAAAGRFGDVADALLLEGWSAQERGGVGAAFDWEAAAAARRELSATLHVVAAGGLTPENVGRAVALLAPDVVDVSSGVEEETGVKSAVRMQAFVDAVRRAKGLE
jgi:phosphoribosylanthranilate isomerase